MPNLTGSSSVFDLTHRDVFTRPNQTGNGGTGGNSSLDATFINHPGDAIIKLQEWSLPTFRLSSGLTPSLSPTIQRWTINVASDPGQQYPVILDLSPVFLEDCGAISAQTISPSQAKTSLASAVTKGVPRFEPTPGGSPAWTQSVQDPSITVRLIGATGSQTFATTYPVFTDAGDGVSPQVSFNLFLSHPDLINTDVPTGTYEICLMSQAWVD